MTNYAHFTVAVPGRHLIETLTERCKEIEEDLEVYIVEARAAEAVATNQIELDGVSLPVYQRMPVTKVERAVTRQVAAMRRVAELLSPAASYDLTVEDLRSLGLLPDLRPRDGFVTDLL